MTIDEVKGLKLRLSRLVNGSLCVHDISINR